MAKQTERKAKPTPKKAGPLDLGAGERERVRRSKTPKATEPTEAKPKPYDPKTGGMRRAVKNGQLSPQDAIDFLRRNDPYPNEYAIAWLEKRKKV